MNSAGKTDADVATYFAQIKNPYPDITNPCGTTKIDATDCDPHLSELKTGSERFNIVAGKYMYLNGYEILITAPNEGLLYLPLIQSRIPVEWSGLTVMASENGIYGCVTEGEARMQGSVTGAIGRDLHRQVMALLTQGAGSFSGKFGEALKKISAIGDSLKNGQTVNWGYTKGVLDAAKTGYEEWKTQVNSYFTKDGAVIPPAVQDILAGIQAKQDKYQQLSACVVQNIPSGGGGNAVPKRLKAAIFACNLTDEDENVMIISKTDAEVDIEELALFDTDPDPIGPVFNKNNGDFLGGTKEGALSGKLYFIEPNKLFALEEKYGIGTPKLVPSKVLKKYGEGKRLEELSSTLQCPSPSSEIAEIISNSITYIVGRTPMNNFGDVPSNFMSMLRNGKISTYFCTNSSCDCVGTNTPSALSQNTLAAENTTNSTITFNLDRMKSDDELVTVENIQCVFIHEFVGHRIREIGKEKGHYMAYDIQKQYIYYNKVTEGLKADLNIRF